MRIYLMRHGNALDVGEQGVRRDSERPLSDKGVETCREVAQGLVTLGVNPDLVVSSPLVRARQTAEVVAETLGGRPLSLSPLLAPSGSLPDLLDWLHKGLWDSVLLVGHMPDLAVLASLLLCSHPNAGIDFKKSAVCCIAFLGRPAPGSGDLQWFLPPKPLIMIARGKRHPAGSEPHEP